MDDEFHGRLEQACWELLVAERWEPTLRELFARTPHGTWTGLDSVQTPNACDGMFFTWLPQPQADPDFVLVIFLHEESGWTMTAAYNAGRLLRRASGLDSDA